MNDENKNLYLKYLEELKRLSGNINYAYVDYSINRKNGDLTNLKEVEKKIITTNKKCLFLKKMLEETLIMSLSEYEITNLNIFFEDNILFVVIKLDNDVINYVFYKENDRYCFVIQDEMNNKEIEFGKNMEIILNKLYKDLKKYFIYFSQGKQIISIDNSFIKLIVSQDGITIDNCIKELSLDNRIDVLNAYSNLKNRILNRTCIDEDVLIDYYPNVKENEYQKVLRMKK